MKRIYLSWSSDCNLEQSLPNIKKRIIGDCELIYTARLTSHDVDPTCLFPILKNCDAIFMLRGWEKEKKCLLEKIYAEYLGIRQAIAILSNPCRISKRALLGTAS